MRKSSILLPIFGLLLLISEVGYSAHCDFAANVRSASHDLDTRAQHFHHLIHAISGYSHLASDAHRLAAASRHLHDVAHSSASCSHIRADFYNVERAFYHLQYEYEHAHSTHHNYHVARDWSRVDYAFSRVRRAIYGWDDHHLSVFDTQN